MTLPVARDLAAIGVRVNTVAPGLIEHTDLRLGGGVRRLKANLQLFPQRLGYPEELASVVLERLPSRTSTPRRSASTAASGCHPRRQLARHGPAIGRSASVSEPTRYSRGSLSPSCIKAGSTMISTTACPSWSR
jgi:hypothetical protein